MESLLNVLRVLLTSRRLPFLPIFGLVSVGLNSGATLQAQFPGRGDDVTPSLGQFNLVVDPHFENVITSNPAYAPYLSNKGGHLNFTSPILFDPTTTIGRSDPLNGGSAEDTAGVLAGILAPHLLQDGQFTVRPSFAEGPDGTREVHTFIESIHLTGSGFEVKAGNQAPLRPLSAGEVESLSGNSEDPTRDFPANSFFDVFVEVDVPALGGFPMVQLVNVDPLLVQSESITSFPPTVLYIHGNSSAVPLYFYADIPAVGIHRGDLFGQLTLAGHGVGFTESDVAEFEAAETEAETHHGRLPLQDNPIAHVTIVDEVPNTPTPTPTSPACIGDCGGDQAVTVDEILILVNIVLGSAQASACPRGIASGAEVDIAVIIQAVNHALTNCPAS
jgi:hypothetical protein